MTPVKELGQRASPCALKLPCVRPRGRESPMPGDVSALDLNPIPDSDPVTRKANAFHRSYAMHSRSRFDKLQAVYEQMGRPSNLIVMICSEDYLIFLALWLRSCDRAGVEVRDRCLVFSLDPRTHRECLNIGLASYSLDPEVHCSVPGTTRFGDLGFSHAMYYKNACILSSLDLGANILFQDVDLLWLSDPFPLLEREGSADIQGMYDGPNPLHDPCRINTGFLYLQNSTAVRSVFMTCLCNSASIFACGSHQQPFNRILGWYISCGLIEIEVLAEQQFLNGHLFNLETGLARSADSWPSTGLVVHYSWTANCEQKLDKLRTFSLVDGLEV